MKTFTQNNNREDTSGVATSIIRHLDRHKTLQKLTVTQKTMVDIEVETPDSQGNKVPDETSEERVWKQLMGKDIQLKVSGVQ